MKIKNFMLFFVVLFCVAFVLAIPGDYNDGVVDPLDILIMKLCVALDSGDPQYPGNTICNNMDIDGDGDLDFDDIELLKSGISGSIPFVDNDNDGVISEFDCDDNDPGRSPTNTEALGNAYDEDCSMADFSLSGGVDDSVNNIFEALVEIICIGSEASALTDENGYFYLTSNNQINNCNTEVNKDGFLTYTSPSYNLDIRINTENPQLTQNDAIAGAISGTVIDDMFNAMPYAKVIVMEYSSASIVQVVYADANGDYIVNGLPATMTYDLYAELYTWCWPSEIFSNPTDVGITIGGTVSNQFIFLNCGEGEW